jgi:Alpha-L-rhamnosidase N-terminal domain./Bacterial alpha-L-rhamnosidase.
LRCEGRLAPADLEVRRPLLSWQLAASTSARGQRQTAYHVIVSSTFERLDPAHPDRWDSGVVESSACSALYAGVSLSSLEQCVWAVRVRDEHGGWSAWERSGAWSTALLDPTREWVAHWIGLAPEFASTSADANPPDPWLRRKLELEAVPERAIALVASVGFHELYVNGRKVGDDLLMPNVCDGSKRAFYVRYDIAAHLRPGENVLALWLGTGWSAYPHFRDTRRAPGPLVSAQFFIARGGHAQWVLTDGTWLSHPSPSRLLGSWEFQNFGGERYDARAEIDGWAESGIKLDGWRPAAVSGLNLPVSADLAEPNRAQEELRPVSIDETAPGVYRVDFGRNFAGFVEVSLAAPPGSRILLESSEDERESTTHSLRSEYIVGASGRGVFRNRFNYVAGRWLTLRGLSSPPDAAGVRAWCVRNDYASAAHFESSSDRLNAITAAARWTFENLTIGGFVADCPHRERMGYGGDGHANTLTGLYHYRLDKFLAKWNRDWLDAQGHPPLWSSRHDPTAIEPPPSNHPGEMPYTAPTYWGGGGPAWSGFFVQLTWQLYRFYGDRRVLERNLPAIERWLDFLETHVSGGILRRWGGKWDFLGDWLCPTAPRGVNSDRDETLFFNNCYRVWSLALAARIARAMDHPRLASRWENRATEARTAIHAEFHEAETGGYLDNSQVSLAMALLAEIPPPSLRPAVERQLEDSIRLTQEGHLNAGITGGAMLFHYLLESHRHDLLHLVVNQPGYPGWSYMLDQGATTLWETWEEPSGNLSRLHSSFLYVGAWPINGVLGISPVSDSPGFARVRIVPGPIDAPDLTWARGHYESVRGRIGVAWRISAGEFSLEVEIPPGVEAEIGLPSPTAHGITESDRPLEQAPAVTLLRSEAARTFVTVSSGAYRFSVPLHRRPDVSPAR